MAKDEKRNLDKPLQIRISAELKDLFALAAKKDGRSVSNWVRDRLKKAARSEVKDS